MSAVQIDVDGYLKRIASAEDATSLDALELEIFSRKSGVVTMALKELGTLSPEEKKERGRVLNEEKKTLEEAIAERRGAFTASTLSSLGDSDRLDVTLELPESGRGHLHLIPEFMREVEEVFGRMGFDVARGPEIESEDINFGMLNIPADHPARDMQETFFVAGKKGYVLRTHTSNVQIRYMQSHKPPFRMICPGKVYRKDADATHSPMFHQFEGLMIGKDVSLANMKAVMSEAIRELLSPDIEFRFRASYFPFVEPGLEVDMRWAGKSGKEAGAWLEVAGCGMVHPNVLKNVGIDAEEWQGFAFGFGVERLLMIRHGIRDLRAFYEGDWRFLEQF